MSFFENINIYWQYLKYTIEHKRNVYRVCRKRGLTKHAIVHDMSKLSLSEFRPYAFYFYKDKERYRDEFEKAWQHHYKHNPHHWEHWVDSDGVPQDIPIYYIACMIADWEAMSIKFGDTPQAYYMQNYYKFNLTYSTRIWIEYMLGLNMSCVHNCGRTLEDFFIREEGDYTEWRDKENRWLMNKYGVDLMAIFKQHREENKK